MTPQYKTRTDNSGRNYYLCICPKCQREKEIRVDHIKGTTCKHKKPVEKKVISETPKISKTFTCHHRWILHARPQIITVIATSEKEFNKKISELKKTYTIK